MNMMSSDLRLGDKAVFTLLTLLSVAFASGSMHGLLVQHYLIGSVFLLGAVIFFTTGICWPGIRERLGIRFVSALVGIATDYRIRYSIGLVVLSYILLVGTDPSLREKFHFWYSSNFRGIF